MSRQTTTAASDIATGETAVFAVAANGRRAACTLPPLSVLTYYRRNLARTLPVGGAIVISVFLIASIVTLLNSVDESITTNFGFVRKFSVLATQLEKDVPPRTLAKAKQNPHLGETIVAIPYARTIRTVFGQMPVPVYGLDSADMARLARLCGNRLVAGRWPAPGEPELVLSRAWANNYGVRVGDWIESREENLPTLPDRQRLVGVLDGGENLAIADKSYLLLALPEPVIRPSYLLVPRSPKVLLKMNAAIGDLIDKPKKHGLSERDVRFVKFYTFDGLVKQLRRTLGFLYKFLSIADALVIGAVALLSGFLANIYFEQRLGEFGLLSAFGFRREKLARRVMIETGSLVVAGWLLGMALTWLLFRLLEVFYMRPRGLVLAPIGASAFLYTVPIPILVGLASLATVLLRLYRMDPIEIMERR